MLIFTAFGSLFYFVWILCGIIAPVCIPPDKLKIPSPLKLAVFALAILAGPIVPVVALAIQGCRQLANFKQLEAERKEQQKLNDIVLENANGMFVTDNNSADNCAINTVKRLILQGFERHASDIFLDPIQNGACQVRMRIDGTLRKTCTIDLTIARTVESALKVIAGMDITERRRPQDGAFSAKINGETISFRVASVGAHAGEKISIRILGAASGPRTIDELGLSKEDYDIISQAIKLPSGMVLMCGPTGSGKTSTLYAMLKSIDYNVKNVMSIEDPVENIMPEISQMEVNTKAGITFAALLRNALRQNPDIICLGEIRDEETAEIAVQAAQTGHLIIATVHSNDNLGTVDRLQNLGIPLRTIAATLHIIISQRLIRTLCPHCKQKSQISPELARYFAQANLQTENIYIPHGCPQCDGTGYAGRRAIFDIMVVNHQLRNLLESDTATIATIQNYIEKEHGSSMMAYKGYQLVAQGISSVEEVNRIVLDLE